MSKSKRTKNQQEYVKEIGKLKSIITRNLNLGYDVDYETILALTNNFQMPKRVTDKAIQAIKEIRKPEYFHENFTNKDNSVSGFSHTIPEGKTIIQDYRSKAGYKENKEVAPFEFSEWLADTLSRIPDHREFYYGQQLIDTMDTESYNNKLYQLYIDKQNEMNNKGMGKEYIRYLDSEMGNISDYIDTIIYSPYKEEVQRCFLELANIINQGITYSVAKSISEMSEGFEQDNYE